MILSLVLGIGLGALSVVFALQNNTIITVQFFAMQFQGSLALVMLMSMAMGILVSLLMVLPETVGNYFRYRRLSKQHRVLEEELRKQKELTHFAKHTPATQAELDHLDSGVISAPTYR